jgi:hypothetical protein
MRHLFAAALVAILAFGAASPAHAQDVMTKESAAALKAAFIADVDAMQKKFVALAEAFPQDKYSWRPMEGVRSVSEVLMLAAFEGYNFIPNSFGGKPADLGPREEAAKLRTLSDKPQVIEHLNKGFAHAKQQLDSIDPATLTGKRKVFNQDRSTPEIAMFVGGDLHEHLGQLIAYARTNHIVPPWSK